MFASTVSPSKPLTEPTKAGRIPLWVKVLYTAFVCVLVPYYWAAYGPTNFLYFCDVALLLTVPALWAESPLLASACALGILLPQALWGIDFLGGLYGKHLTGMTEYMFDERLPLFTRALSFFHCWLPFLLVWLVWRLGYDRRAFWAWTGLAWALMLASYFLLPPPPAPQDAPNTPVNVNYVYGFSDKQPQQWMDPRLFLVLMLLGLPLVVYLPTHLMLGAAFARPAGSSLSSAGVDEDALRMRRLSLALTVAGLVSVFRAAALIFVEAGSGFWPLVLALALLFPGSCGAAYCVLAARVARGSRPDLRVAVAASAVLFVPYLLLGLFETEHAPPQVEALGRIPGGPLLGQIFYGAQLAAIAAHVGLLGWVIVGGFRLSRRVAGREVPAAGPSRPSLWANLLLVFAGFVVGYGWCIVSGFVADQFGLRGPITYGEWGATSGPNDPLIVALSGLFVTGALAVGSRIGRWRCWGLAVGSLVGAAFAFQVVTHFWPI